MNLVPPYFKVVIFLDLSTFVFHQTIAKLKWFMVVSFFLSSQLALFKRSWQMHQSDATLFASTFTYSYVPIKRHDFQKSLECIRHFFPHCNFDKSQFCCFFESPMPCPVAPMKSIFKPFKAISLAKSNPTTVIGPQHLTEMFWNLLILENKTFRCSLVTSSDCSPNEYEYESTWAEINPPIP